MGKLHRFQMQGFDYWAPKIDKKNHIGSIFAAHPQKATDLMVQLLGWHKGKTLDTFLNRFPSKEFETDDEYTWSVIASARRNVPLLEARDENGAVVTTSTSSNVGAHTAPFYLVFAEAAFHDGEYIVGNLNEIYQFRILGDAREEGTNYVYKVELAGGNTEGIEPSRLLAGERFSVETAYVEGELSRKVGGIRYSTPVSMRNEWSHVRITHKVSGAMLNRKLAIGIPIAKETTSGYKVDTVDMWMHWADWEVEQQFSEYKNNAMVFGRSNRTKNGEYMNIGKSGEAIRTGDGLLAQMEVANTSYYNTFSIKLLEDALYELSASKLDMGERYFVIRTGERGALQFHKAVMNELNGWQKFQINADQLGMIQKTTSPLHKNALAVGFQFTEFLAPNGVRVKVEVDPWYDDPVRNKVMHYKGGVAQSYRYDIFDIGSMDQPNIFKCKIKGNEEYRGYRWGIRNPFTGQAGNPYMSYDEDSAEFHRMATLGVCVLDPTRTMSLIPAVLQGA